MIACVVVVSAVQICLLRIVCTTKLNACKKSVLFTNAVMRQMNQVEKCGLDELSLCRIKKKCQVALCMY